VDPGFLLEWRLDPALLAAVTATAALYLAGARRARRWPAVRTAAFLAGLALLVVALQSGLHARGEQLLSVHMVQHLVLTMGVPPLLLLGAPLSLALRTVPASGRRSLARTLRGPLRGLAHPVVTWALFTFVLVGSHAPAIYDAALRHEPLHEVEHAVYLCAALLFWLPLVGSEPLPAGPSPAGRILYLLASMPPMALVGVGLVADSHVAYAAYLEPARARGVSALSDQHAGGMVMWVGGTLVLAVAVLAVGWVALRREEERQLAREAYRDRAEQPEGGRA
jgi:putative membrane protein